MIRLIELTPHTVMDSIGLKDVYDIVIGYQESINAEPIVKKERSPSINRNGIF